MRVLITTDTIGGVWQYSLALARGLVERHDCRVGLACFGQPAEGDREDVAPREGMELFSLPLKLEWMPDSAGDVMLAKDEISHLARDWGAHIVHANQFCMGSLDVAVPRVVVAHSDILGWIMWHRGDDCLQATLLSRDPAVESYRRLVVEGLCRATAVVSPSSFMACSLESIYGVPSTVIHNGLWPDLYSPIEKETVALLVGRLWDESKHAATAVEAVSALPVQLHLVGPSMGPTGETCSLPAAPNARYLGAMNWRSTRDIIRRARFFLATASYEPFGLAALEAALSGCTVVANDIPSYREIWGDAAVFYRRNEADDLRRKLAMLLDARGEAERVGRACRRRALALYTADRMTDEYFALYARLIEDHATSGAASVHLPRVRRVALHAIS